MKTLSDKNIRKISLKFYKDKLEKIENKNEIIEGTLKRVNELIEAEAEKLIE